MRSSWRRWILVSTVALAGCSGSDATSVLGPFGGIPLGLGYGGNSAAGIGGFGVGTGWAYMFDGFLLNSGTCVANGSCGVGGSVSAFGTLSNGGENFYVVLTQNVFDLSHNGDAADVVRSGIETLDLDLPGAGSFKALRLGFDFAFAVNRAATAGDSALVQITGGGTTAVLLRLRSSDLGAALQQRTGGCGNFTVPLDAVLAQAPAFARCSDWTPAQFDVTSFRGQKVRIQFLAFEGDGDRNAGTDHPVALLFRKVELSGAQ